MTPAGSKDRSEVDEKSHDGPKGSEFELRELWRGFREGDDIARERLILNYAPLVKATAGRLGLRLPSHVSEGDLISYGLSGLLEAIERYDPGRGVLFESFALLRIRGAMLDALRLLDWVPRSVRERAREVERAEASLGLKLGRPSTETELAAGLELDIGELRQRLLEIYNSRIYSFDAPLPGYGENGVEGDSSMLDVVADHDSSNPEEALEAAEETGDLSTVISAVIADLPERQQFILSCRYHEDLRLSEIGEVLGISESRVSQLHAKALISLRVALGIAGSSPADKKLQLAYSRN